MPVRLYNVPKQVYLLAMDMESIPQIIETFAASRQWTLRQPGDLEALWDAMGQEDDFGDERIPYWTELWPSSVALANYLLTRQKDIAGSFCLDLGCGLGLTAMTGRSLGARMLAMDYEMDALNAARANAEINNIPNIEWILMDWRKPALRQASLEYIWAGDIIYERRSMQPVLRFMEYGLAMSGCALIAEPGRTIFEGFVDLALAGGWSCKPVYRERIGAVAPQTGSQNVTVWQLSKERR